MLGTWNCVAKCEKGPATLFAFRNRIIYYFSESAIFYYNVIFFCKASDSCKDLAGTENVNGKYAVVEAYGIGKKQVLGKTRDCDNNVWMDQKIVSYAQNRPKAGKTRADDPVYISPFVGIVPKMHLQQFDRYDSGDIFDGGHGNCHNNE